MNVFDFPELANNLLKEFPHQRIIFNVLSLPHDLSIYVLPNRFKKRVREKLSRWLETEKLPSYIISETNALIQLLKDENTSQKRLIEILESHDRVRKLNFKEIFPEFAASLITE